MVRSSFVGQTFEEGCSFSIWYEAQIMEFGSKPVNYYLCYWALTYDMELNTKDLGTWGKTVRTHTILVISSWVLECIMEVTVGWCDADCVLGADPKEL
jgi:hypothetical protein